MTKIRKHRKREWWFFPPENSKICKGRCYTFKYKSDLMRFLNNNLNDAINGEVRLEERSFGSSYCIRMWDVWYNEKQILSGAKLKPVLLQATFNGKKYLHRPDKISKDSKKFFAFSDKVINLMSKIGDYYDVNKEINKKDAVNLTKLFYKRGFKDFTPNEDEQKYINHYLKKGICFWYWSDRCNWLRTKTIIEYFKVNNLI